MLFTTDVDGDAVAFTATFAAPVFTLMFGAPTEIFAPALKMLTFCVFWLFERFDAKALLFEKLLPGITTIGAAEEELADGVLDDELEAGVELDELDDGVELEEELAGVELELDEELEEGIELDELDDWQTTVVVTTLLFGFGLVLGWKNKGLPLGSPGVGTPT